MGVLEQLARWTRHPHSCGVDLRGPTGELVRIVRGQPLEVLGATIAREIGASAGAFRMEPFHTLEGEHAVLATGDGWALAVVIGDERADVVFGHGDVEAIVQDLANHSELGLGEVRRRPYVYAPPAGWQGLARPACARWLHPEFPRTTHVLVVHHVRPRTAKVATIDRLVIGSSTYGRAPERPHAIASCVTARGLDGEYTRSDYRVRGALHSVVSCTVRDVRFCYTVDLVGPAASVARDLETLNRVVESIESVPEPRRIETRVRYWGDV